MPAALASAPEPSPPGISPTALVRAVNPTNMSTLLVFMTIPILHYNLVFNAPRVPA
jgi:hypothetical protein